MAARDAEQSLLYSAHHVSQQNPKSYDLLGVRVHAMTMTDLNQYIREAIVKSGKIIVANHNLHSVYLIRKNTKFRDFFQKARYIHVDGMSLIFVAQLLGIPLQRSNRVTYVDWLGPLISDAVAYHWRLFYLGSRPGVAENGAEILRRRYPGLEIQTAPGYFNAAPDGPDNCALIDTINSYAPHVLFVGMGMPRQEQWILENLDRLNANAILTAGAAIDYVAGIVATPPRWTGRIGLEWFFRLAHEPRRLWRRYLLEPALLVGPIVVEVFKKRLFGADRTAAEIAPAVPTAIEDPEAQSPSKSIYHN
jgi:N-acetylglucosaminyldiphosphoundecaprenol N-acetyl-beta-D-mannosaminyltransferase